MAGMAGACRLYAVNLLLITFGFLICYAQAQTQAYVAYMGSSAGLRKGFLRSSHLNMLASTVGSFEGARNSLLYSYTHSINGFSAVLSKQQAQQIASMPGVISVFPSRMHKLHTTRSWDFLGLDADYVEGSLQSRLHPPITSDVIIGLLDTGVWPELESFKDDGMGPIPSKWKGKCVDGDQFNSSNCNRKLIGARYYGEGSSVSMDPEAEFAIYEGPNNNINELPRPITDYGSARDSQGHGSHTATTAGGRAVTDASFYGLAKGVARGGAPLSRIATYKVCSEGGCSDSDILAAFDDAIQDGVDILSLSLGAPSFLQPDIMTDGIAIGAFHAVQNGILVVCSAGNDGPYSYTVVNTAPWILTVAASTLDRFFDSKVVLGNGKTFEGQALNYYNLSQQTYPIVFGGDIPSPKSSKSSAGRCTFDSLDATKAKGKIVLCLQDIGDASRKSKSLSVQSAGGVGMIIADDTNKFMPNIYTLSATQVSKKSGMEIQKQEKEERVPEGAAFCHEADIVIHLLSIQIPATTVRISASNPAFNMVLEATMICIDNSEWMRNGDYSPTRLQAQADAVNLICGAKTQSNPENTVGVITTAGKGVRVLVTPTSDFGKILASMHGLEVGGESNLTSGVQIAQLALKHRQNKKQQQRIIVFAGSPIKTDKKILEVIGKKLKKNNVALDVVDFGEDDDGKPDKLEALLASVNSNDNSHIVHVPAGPNVLTDVLISSSIFTGDGEAGSGFAVAAAAGAAAAAAAAAGGAGGFDFGVDPNLDPELALALRVSMEEERARQEAAAKRAAEDASAKSANEEQEQGASSHDVARAGTTTSALTGMAQSGPDPMEDETALLEQALAMSMNNQGAPQSGTALAGDTSMTEARPEDEDLAFALQMSMQEATKGSSGSMDMSKVLGDQSFVSSVLASLPGVDPNDPSVKDVLASLQDNGEEKEKGQEKQDGEK